MLIIICFFSLKTLVKDEKIDLGINQKYLHFGTEGK
jgi:hypothetical protein